MSLRRIDAELVRRGLARSREAARELIQSGSVELRGMVVTKANRQVSTDDPLVVRALTGDAWVSRGAHKLLGALDAFSGVVVADRVCLDAGASTGGFTDVLLGRGARRVFAVDVGYGQLAWKLRSDDRVTVMDRTNIRYLAADQLDEQPGLVVGDLSFISLTTVLPALAGVSDPHADLVLMVKPQFEVGRERLGKRGVVRDPELRIESVLEVAGAATRVGLGVRGVVASPLPGPNGNVEYFLWLHADAPPVREDDVRRAVAEGPQ